MGKNITEMNQAELLAEVKKCREILNMLHSVLGGIAKMAVKDLHILYATEGYYRMTGYTEAESHLPPFSDCGMNLIIPEDLPQVQHHLEMLLREKRPVNADYRIRRKDGSIAWNTAYCAGVDESADGQYIEVFFLDSTDAKTTELQLTSLLNNMSSGLVRLRVDETIRIVYANDAFYRQTGYSSAELNAEPLNGNPLELVHPNDKAILLERLDEFLKTDHASPQLDLRIIAKEGSIRWIRVYASRLYDEPQGNGLIQCILTDVTDELLQEKQNMLNEERFRIIAEQTRDVIFDWDISCDSIHYSPVFEKMFGFMPPASISTKEALASDLFFEEDKPIIQKLISDMSAAHPYVECRARMKGKDGAYFWTLHRSTTIYDENRKSLLVVGVISDVNDFMQSTLDLQHKAEHDPLTGLLNRMAAKGLIEPFLHESPKGQIHVFAQFDIDRFKQINDFMGHAAGDFALQKIALQMRETFRGDDYLIRMGGDEFAIFLVSPSSVEGACKKLKQFLQKVACDFMFAEKIYPLSISVGASVYPQHGRTFQALYEHADHALYQAKRAGGNRLELFVQKGHPKARHAEHT